MRNPLKRLKDFPWYEMAQAAALASALDTLLAIALFNPVTLQEAAAILLSPLLGAFLIAAIGFGVGAIAVYCMERLHRHVFLTAGVLWALVLCVMLSLWLKSLLLPTLLSGELALVGVTLGIFWKGKRYWR
ncbi:MAG: peptide chain release factor 1 [Microcoleus sp. SIO2G3]|nr:peptide chain release factor 1 [Microcoleus sp. SIO2G3]